MRQLDECHEILADPYGYAKDSRRRADGRWSAPSVPMRRRSSSSPPGPTPFGSSAQGRRPGWPSPSAVLLLLAGEGGAGGCPGGAPRLPRRRSLPHTCDTIQRLSDIWRLNVGDCFHLDLVLPVKLDTESARHYLADVLNRFRGELGGKLGVTISDADLRSAIALTNRIRGALTRIAGSRARGRGP